MRSHITHSDIASVLVGDENFGYAISNAGDDGVTIVEIYGKDEEIPEEYSLKNIELVEGKFNIYNYDCSERKPEDIIETLEGRYLVYSYPMHVAFKEI